ncbi:MULTISPECIES: phasin family protein [Hydrocarboniphaga]|jgi:hypothetical protein|uniref:Uncharacterized protein n=1 Tax=Hydrocarboniphaga effusa AP103 TaxID=1172194 RepID=I7ZH43_9GAMM|nr:MULTISPECIES: phasin family protein [Hydrocarboniphaga]EIT71042.1 hypothetical protein WQQ_11790 [Hydrocarboniphaga effusa AP103]MDZ4079108.1 phasin family protein [Hydrocarboniphaga sp.]
MSVQAIVHDVKGRVEPYVAKGQQVVTVSVDTFKKATPIVVDGVQSLVHTQIEAGKDLFAAVQGSFEKAKTAGIKAVAASPIEYLPDGRERVLSAYNDSVVLVSKTSDKLVKLVKSSFATVDGEAKKTAAPRKTTAKKATKKAAKKAA